ncbi:hypothetical protein HAX54_036910 [Datura stramonium]|uniref:Uncharacterized protein n=1 Tax=Datura stramonium TaxID=4076 RepID=A0ABS8VHH1_DATST|nr:hypothetical protein [Datura stramonium]
MQKGKAILSNERVVGDPGKWKIVKDGRASQALIGSNGEIPINNKFEVINNEEEAIINEHNQQLGNSTGKTKVEKVADTNLTERQEEQDREKAESKAHTCHTFRDIGEFLTVEGWDFKGMKEYVLDYMIKHAKQNLSTAQLCDQADKPWWTKTSSGCFDVNSLVLMEKEKHHSTWRNLCNGSDGGINLKEVQSTDLEKTSMRVKIPPLKTRQCSGWNNHRMTTTIGPRCTQYPTRPGMTHTVTEVRLDLEAMDKSRVSRRGKIGDRKRKGAESSRMS